jgi:hypothetical protein
MGAFAQIADVTLRYVEGTMPADLTAAGGWVDERINDVENELIGLVPSLQGASAASLEAADPARAGRVLALVAGKVVDLYRNPQRAKQLGQAMADINSTASLSNAFDAMIDFTEEELNRVRLRTPRPRFGTARVTPFKINTREAYAWPGY